jgi:ATP-binding cassette subfamily C protein/ATP-binding cassette subfamily C protein EexD
VASNGQLAGALGIINGSAAQWESFNRAHVGAAYSLGKRASFIKAMARSVRVGSQIAIYGVGAWLVVKNELAPGALVSSAILLARALAPLEGLVSSVKAIRIAFGAYRRLKALPEEGKVPALAPGGDAVTGLVSLIDVTYYHPGRKTPALRSISLDLKPGESLGIVGPNGAGKSTLSALLAGAMSPTAGSASLDGVPITKWQRGECAPPIGYLSDESLLLEGTVHENIARFGDMSVMAVARAAMRAGVHETLQALHAGYDTPVGHAGSGLSLRERRAVGFARAVAGEPKIVILDEPEIGLDGSSMKRLARDLEPLKQSGIALIIATQDPRLLTLVDKVAVLAGGTLQSFANSSDFARTTMKPRVVAGAGEGQ